MSMGAAAVYGKNDSVSRAIAENDAHGPGEGERPPLAALPLATVAALCVSSMLFVGLASWVLRRRSSAAADEVAYLSAVARRLPPLVCAYLFSWTVALSGARGAPLVESFVRASYLPLLAAAAAEQIGPFAGAATMFAATVYSAAAAGRAVAHRRLGAGAERSAAWSRSRAKEELELCRRAAIVFTVVFSAATVASLLWLLARFVADDGGPPLEVSPSPETTKLCPIKLIFAPYLLFAGLVLLQPDGVPVDHTSIAFALVSWTLPCLFVLPLFGEVAMVAVFWVGGIAIAGLVGCSLAVQACCNKQLMAIKRTPLASDTARATPAEFTSRRAPAGGIQQSSTVFQGAPDVTGATVFWFNS